MRGGLTGIIWVCGEIQDADRQGSLHWHTILNLYIIVRLVGVFQGIEGIQTLGYIKLPVLCSGNFSYHNTDGMRHKIIYCSFRSKE